MTKKPSLSSLGDVMSILRDVQAQTELERAKRIKLEAEVEKARQRRREKQQQKQQQQQQQVKEEHDRSMGASSSPTSRRRRRSSRSSSNLAPDKKMIALQTQVDGYRELMELLTKERPAIAAAMLRERQRLRGGGGKKFTTPSNNILPLKLVRLLELIPWHPYAEERVDVQDDVYEWQRFDPILQDWRGDLPSFPDFFHALPTTTSPHGDDSAPTEGDVLSDDDNDDSSIGSSNDTTTDDQGNTKERRSSLQGRRGNNNAGVATNNAKAFDFPSFLAGLLPSSRTTTPDKPPVNNCDELVLTNANLTLRYVLNAKDGYPLPNPTVSGTWKWIGRWMVDRSGDSTNDPPQSHNNKAEMQPQQRKSILTFFDNNDEDKEESIMVSKDSHCDEEGWTYAREASHFVLWNAKELCSDNASAFCSCPGILLEQKNDEAPLVAVTNDVHNDGDGDAPYETTATTCFQCQHRRKPVLRRRKWTRQRLLVDYPLASESSLEYLRLAANNASMKLATQELSERLMETTNDNKQVQDHWETTEKTHKVQLEHYLSTWEQHEERIKQLRYGKFKRKIEELACNQDDILPIIANPNLFTQLQRALRQSGAITNAMLQQGIHFYILDHVRPVHGKSQRRKPSIDLSSRGSTINNSKRGLSRRTSAH